MLAATFLKDSFAGASQIDSGMLIVSRPLCVPVRNSLGSDQSFSCRSPNRCWGSVGLSGGLGDVDTSDVLGQHQQRYCSAVGGVADPISSRMST